MAQNDKRYEPVATTLPPLLPAITREEATRAAKKLYRHFGGTEHGSVDMLTRARWRRHYRSKRGALPSWVSKHATAHDNNRKGWGALIHDVSHDIHDQRTPRLRPHDGAHAKLEAEVAAYVVAQGWLAGTLKPSPKAKPTPHERRVAKLANLDKRIKKWTTRQKRATTALRKLSRQRRALEIKVAEGTL